MKKAVAVIAILAVSTCCLGQAVSPDPEPTWQEDYESASLPKYRTPAEMLLPPLSVERDDRAPPTGQVHCSAEYEPCAGVFLAWESYTDILTTLAVEITTRDPEAIVYVVVDSTSEQSSVSSTLSNAGADMAQVQFIVRTTDTVWIRDYGPRFIFEDGNRAIIDHTYNRPRPNDNLLNDYISSLWGEPQYQIPLEHGGGNFHLFATGDAFMSDLILDENPGETEQSVKDLYAAYQNVNLTIYPGFPTWFDSTQHIDMWMLPVDDDEIIIGEYASSTGQPYTITENATADLQGQGYTVYRTPGWNSGGTHYTYTNAIVFNDLVFVSTFNVSQDATALAVFQTAFEDKTIIQVDCQSIIHAAGALHCICMHVPKAAPDPNPHVTVLTPNGGEQWYVGTKQDIAWNATDDVGVTSIDIYYSTDGGLSYPHVIATGEDNDGVFAWTVPDTPAQTCRVKVVAWDADLNSGEDESDDDFEIASRPPVVYSFPLDSDPGWSTEGEWAYGVPQGGGTHNDDPNSGHTGDNVYGYDLLGDYNNSIQDPYYLTTTPLDCTGLSSVELWFWRWLGVEEAIYDHASLEVSNNGTDWIVVWENPLTPVADYEWVQVVYDISAVADDQPAVYVRWGIGPTDDSVTYPGWNIDDVEIRALGGPAWCLGDMNCSGGPPEFTDINYFVSAIGCESCWWQYYRDNHAGADAPCSWLLGDYPGTPVGVEFTDIVPFANSIGLSCVPDMP